MRIRFSVVLGLVLHGLIAPLAADTFGNGANEFELEFITVGAVGNAPQSLALREEGGVDYEYRIGTYEVSRETVVHAVSAGGLDLEVSPPLQFSGDLRPEMPAMLTWNQAARFVNWLNASSGHAPAYKFEFQPEDDGYDSNADILLWTPEDEGFSAESPFRNSQAMYFLPNADEWHKAAYFDADANGGTGYYFEYPTGSDSPPQDVPSGTEPGTAVYNQPLERGPANVMEAGGLTPWGVMGMGGNAGEFVEDSILGSFENGNEPRGIRGGSRFVSLPTADDTVPSPLSASYDWRGVDHLPSFSVSGFRVASQVPEPSTGPLFVAVALVCRWRRRSSE